ncbi:hypothetical protein AgCh_022356 [Apium graveolens]
MTLEVLYGILKTYELEMLQRKSLRVRQGHVVEGSSTLVANDSKTSKDELEAQTQVVQAVEQKNKNPQKQVILELYEDEFYTLDELDEMDQSMAYLTRKFSNIRVKKMKYFKSKGQTSNNNNNWKGKTQFNSAGKNDYKPGKPKKVKKDKSYLELKEKYEALLRKQQEKAYITKGKSLDDTDDEDDYEEYENYARMALKQGESSTSKL